MIYPCKDCIQKKTCKKNNSCEKRRKYLEYRKNGIEKNRKWARESTNVCYDPKARRIDK